MIGWILAAISIVGAIMNVKMNRWGFIVWIVANSGWIGFNIMTNTIEQIPIWIVYNIISVWGFYSWSQKKKE